MHTVVHSVQNLHKYRKQSCKTPAPVLELSHIYLPRRFTLKFTIGTLAVVTVDISTYFPEILNGKRIGVKTV